MRIPNFIPVYPQERTRREWSGLILQMLLWGYLVVVLVRIGIFGVTLPWIEDLALNDPPAKWASELISSWKYDSRYFEMEWATLGVLFAVGLTIGLFVSLTSKGLGLFLCSMSKLQVSDEKVALQIKNHWRYAKWEGGVLFLATVMTGWVVTKINLAKAIEPEGLHGALRLILELSCGLPLLGQEEFTFFGSTYKLPFTAYDAFKSILNLLIQGLNTLQSIAGNQAIASLEMVCTPSPWSYYSNALKLLVESLFLAFMATLFSTPIAFVLAFFAASNLTRHSRTMRWLYTFVRTYINISRSIEPLIWAIVLAVWVGIGPFAGALALMIHSISSLVKQYSEAIECVDEGPIEAITATGANRIAVAWFAVVPQVLLPYLAFTIYRWDINVRMSTVIGLVGGGGIGSLLIQEQGLAHWTQVGTIAFLIFLVVWTMDFFSARIRAAIQ